MNFLAHLFLSGERDGVIMGNFAGDFVKGRLSDEKTVNWNPEYVAGLKLHRFIDMFTDAHPVVREAKAKNAQTYGRIAGIVLDIYFDYFLAKYFDKFSPESLWMYSHRLYAIIEKNNHLIPDTMVPMVSAMIRQDWLNSYESLEGIDLTFERMSRRAGFMVLIKSAGQELRKNEQFYFDRFGVFFPELQEMSAQFLINNLDT
jgi:acyl carrier protein phosphodiesterase